MPAFRLLFTCQLVLSGYVFAQEPVPPVEQRPAAEPDKAENQEQEPDKEKEDKSRLSAATFSGLKLREIGPAMTSGRVGDVAVDPHDKHHWYVAAASGGVWETRNCGTTWQPIFDGEASFSIGCLAIDPNDPLTVWVGTGENNSQRSVSYGDGVYKSTDGGKSWKNVGLGASEHIGVIRIDPRNGERVLVAAQGPLWSSGGDRGLYLTEDGGATWQRVLEIDEHTGVTDLAVDPRNPDVMIAASYQRRRHVFTLINGGPGSGLHRTTDGGKTWQKVTRGLPSGDLGRIGLAIAPAKPDTVYAIVEAQRDKGGFYRSTDGGRSWSRRSDYVSGSPQYYQELVADPVDPDRVYSMDVLMQVTEDGGASWKAVGAANKHVDDHALWIDPDDTRHLIAGCDGGVYETFDRGAAWRFMANLPITQFYKITADQDAPFYNVYGGTQDNYSLGGPSRTSSASGIANHDWFVTVGGDGFETVVDPEDPDVVYSQSQHGGLMRFDRRSGETIDIKPREGVDHEPLHWNWNAPLIISPHSHTRLYFAANFLFRSDDRGESWQRVSENLTRQVDRNQLEVMGRVWPVDAVAKNRSTSIYGNIVSLAESPVREGLLWIGTDDGLVQVSADGGATWRRIEAFPGVPDTTYVSSVAASLHDAQTVYAAFDNHKRGDFKPYVLKSSDGGASWRAIAGDLPERGSVHVIVEDHEDPNLLFCGTEFGLFFTRDGGAKWIKLKGGLPPIAVRDLEVQRRQNDLVVGTFGRGIWILDDYTPLRTATEAMLAQPACVFPVAKTWLFVLRRPLGGGGKGFLGDAFFVADNPPDGAVFCYHLADGLETRRAARETAEKKAAEQNEKPPYPTWEQLREEDRERPPQVVLTVRDAAGQVVRRITAPSGKGLHRTSWDLRWTAPEGRGPLVAPGRYSVALATLIDGELKELTPPQEFDVELLPGAVFRAADPVDALAFQQQAAALDRAVDAAVDLARDVAQRLDALSAGLLATSAADPAWLLEAHLLRQRLADAQVALEGDETIESRHEAQLPSLRERARNALASFRSTSGPTGTHRESYRIAADQLDGTRDALRRIDAELRDLEQRLERAGGPPARGSLPDWRK